MTIKDSEIIFIFACHNLNVRDMKAKYPKDTQKYQKHYSDKGLFDKIGRVFKRVGIKAIYYVLLLFYVVKDKNTPLKDKLVILGALGYFIFPTDFIPDFIPIAGFTDDIAAIVACIKAVKSNITPAVKELATKKLNDWFKDIELEKVEGFHKEIDEQ